MQSQTHLHVKYFTSGSQEMELRGFRTVREGRRERERGREAFSRGFYSFLVDGNVSWNFTL